MYSCFNCFTVLIIQSYIQPVYPNTLQQLYPQWHYLTCVPFHIFSSPDCVVYIVLSRQHITLFLPMWPVDLSLAACAAFIYNLARGPDGNGVAVRGSQCRKLLVLL